MSDIVSSVSGNPPAPGTDPTLPMVLAASRTLVATLGGFAIARGWIGSDQASQMGGALVVLITGAFGIYSQYRNKQHLARALTSTTAAPSPAVVGAGQ